MHLFTADGFEGTLSDCDEGTLEWVPKRIMRTFPTWEGDRIFLDLLDQGAPFFSLKLRYEGDRLREAVLNGRRIV
jgi:8-oxo-dGTP diphosphatase